MDDEKILRFERDTTTLIVRLPNCVIVGSFDSSGIARITRGALLGKRQIMRLWGSLKPVLSKLFF